MENMEFKIKMFKEVQVTNSFLGIDESVRGCQGREMYEDCIRHSYLDKFRNSCGCLPIGLKINKNVFFKIIFIWFQLIKYLQDSICTQSSGDRCLIENNLSECKRYFVLINTRL